MHRTRVTRPEYPDEDISRGGLRSFEIFKDRSISIINLPNLFLFLSILPSKKRGHVIEENLNFSDRC